MEQRKPWYWWLQQNVWPWEPPPSGGVPMGTAERKWTPFSQTGYPRQAATKHPGITWKAAQVLQKIGFPIPTNVPVAEPTMQERLESQKKTEVGEGPGGLTDAELKALSMLPLWQFQWQQQQAEQDRIARQQQIMREMEIRGFQAQQGRDIDWRAQQAEEFETWRTRLANQLTGPANEVARWFIMHRANPYQPKPEAGIERAIESATARAEALAGTPEGEEAAAQIAEYRDERRSILAEQAAKEAEFEAGPPTPSWVSQYAPEVGKTLPLEKGLGRVETPSGQQLTRMSPSQSQWLGGTIDWFGGRPWGDILGEAQLMQPRSPGGGARWRPLSQG